MPYFQRSFAAVLIVFVLLFSICVLPENVSARRRCPAEAPDSLLTLYLKSDLIVVASIESEKVLKMTSEYEYGSYFDVEKKLDVSETLKGAKKDQAAYIVSQFTPKNSKNEAGESGATNASEEEVYPGIGNKALFFLTKNAENNSYELADYGAAIKKLTDQDLHVYLKRIKELKKISEAKKNQMPRLIEWLVQLAEEPATRGEGTSDLQASFMALEYEQFEEPDEAMEEMASGDEKVDGQVGEPQTTLVVNGKIGEPQVSQKEPVFPDKDFRAANTSEIARLLTNAQKDRLSNVLSHSINVHLAKLNNPESEEGIAPDYELITLVGHWNKTYLAMNSYAALQNSGTSNARRTSYLLNVIAYLFVDDKLFSIINNYEYATHQPEDEMTEYTEEEEEEQATSIGEVSDAPAEPEISVSIEKNETSVSESTISEPVIVGTSTPDKMQTEPEAVEKEVKKITFKQYKEMMWSKFEKQYKVLIAQSLAAK